MIRKDLHEFGGHEYVNQFMFNYMFKSVQRTTEWNYHSPLNKLKEAAYSFRNKSWSRVGLFKVMMGIIKYKRNPASEDMSEFLFVFLISIFGITGTDRSNFIHFPVEINVEVFCTNHLPFEFFILHLISTKEIELRKKLRCKEKKNKNEK